MHVKSDGVTAVGQPTEVLNDQTINPIELRKAFGTFVTGVTIVTTRDQPGAPRGMTANSFTSVSLDPPLVLICIGKSALSCEAFEKSSSFAVNILHEGQNQLAAVFASKSLDKFENVAFDTVHTGSPVLTDSLSWFDCSVYSKIDAGDHVILIGMVRAFGTSPAAPLGFCRGRYAHVKDALPDGWLPSQGMVMGYLIEKDGKILLRSDGKGMFGLPVSKKRKTGSFIELAGGNEIKVIPESTFLYSVFDVSDGDPGYIVYRASLASDFDPAALAPELQFFSIDQLPLQEVATHDLRAVLRRYIREHADNRFGIYMDHPDGGRIAMLESEMSSSCVNTDTAHNFKHVAAGV